MAPNCLVRELVDCPDLFDLVEFNPDRYPYLLENSGTVSTLGRYDILFAFPGQQLVCQSNGNLTIDGDPVTNTNFLDQLNRIFAENRSSISQAEIPFCGGWFLYLGYELVEEIEPVLKPRLNPPELPRAMMQKIDAGVVRDRQSGRDYIFASGPEANNLLNKIAVDIKSLVTPRRRAVQAADCVLLEEDAERFIDNVERVKNYIRAGDVFQVNLSRRWEANCAELTVNQAWRQLRNSNPSPFAAFARLNTTASILSSSPERLVACNEGIVRTRPIAGTYPRSRDEEQDARLSAELLMHPKERAEHIMLVDLERNDLGRICEPGSIQVDDLMVIESYAHVHHIVSGISGKLRPDILPGDIIRAVFPGGTITGCPKVRCMEIIADLEQEARDAYTGSIGYLCTNGNMDLNILIRTITYSNGRYVFRAGAGIVADSDPQRELRETRSKARGLYRIFVDEEDASDS